MGRWIDVHDLSMSHHHIEEETLDLESQEPSLNSDFSI